MLSRNFCRFNEQTYLLFGALKYEENLLYASFYQLLANLLQMEVFSINLMDPVLKNMSLEI